MSAKHAINDKLQGSVDTYLRCSGVVNNQIKNGLLLSLWVIFFKSVNIWQSYKQERDCLVHFLHRLAVCWPGVQSARGNHVFACNFADFSPIFNFFFTHGLSNKPFLICLLTTPPHFRYVIKLPCNLARSVDINVSQGSVATYARCGEICNAHSTTHWPRNLPVDFLIDYDLTEVWSWICGPALLAHPVETCLSFNLLSVYTSDKPMLDV